MIFRFLMLSDEVAGFKREFQINADDTFWALHKEIIKSVGYQEADNPSFFMCSDNWKRKEEISLVEIDTYSDEDSFTMKDTLLETFLEDEKQRLVYQFDPQNKRCFFMELREIILGRNLKKPTCSQSAGEAPEQFLIIEEEVVVKPVVATDIAEDDEFYGEDTYTSETFNDEDVDDLDIDKDSIDEEEEDFDDLGDLDSLGEEDDYR